MKPILISTIALLLSFGLSMIVTRLITMKRRREGRLTRRRRLVTFGVCLFVLYNLGAIVYFGSYSRATEHAVSCLKGTGTVRVEPIDEGYRFDGPGTDDALVFYPGARVEETAYAELMTGLAEKGLDCFLIKMPLKMAFLGKMKADDVIGKYSYKNWYIGGHSLGGAMAGAYASVAGDKLKGIVMLAAYTDEKLPDGLKMITFTATEDGVLNRDAYEEAKKNWPNDVTEVSIDGGNHAGFGDYGEQSGDNTATISPEEQMLRVADDTIAFVRDSHDSN
ncbi:MAG: alpha/beta hydrolase [Eubacterium sp.]|nr:alpha/beta hydrolase [Eubacterium sp.]